MAKAALIRAKIDEESKRQAEGIIKELGLTPSEAINIFYHLIILHKGLPFEVKIPNKTTEKTFKDTDKGKNLIAYSSKEEMFKDLGL